MKKSSIILGLGVLIIGFTSCERVEPNYIGVLMGNYGKEGKSDFSIQKGIVWIASPGTQLYQVPTWEQRADFEDKVLHLKASDNTEFVSRPVYSYKINSNRAVDIVFDNEHLGDGDEFMRSLENNVLEAKIYDLMKEESRKYSTDALMAEGGSLKFEEIVQKIVKTEFENRGLELMTFSCQLDFSDKVKAKIDSRNEVNTNISVIDQQIAEQRKTNELAELKAQENIIRSKGLTDQILISEFIQKWDGKTVLYGNTPLTLLAK